MHTLSLLCPSVSVALQLHHGDDKAFVIFNFEHIDARPAAQTVDAQRVEFVHAAALDSSASIGLPIFQQRKIVWIAEP